MNHADIELQCRHWVEHVIIRYGICPFAKSVFATDDIQYRIIDSSDLEQQAMSLMGQLQLMKTNPTPETALLVFPTGVEDFEDYLLLLEVCNQLLEQRQETDVIQLASFHPDYLFEGEPEDSPSHFSNRSPWPIIHLIRQDSIARALENFAEPESIPERNIALMHQIGHTKLEQQLQAIRSMTA